MPEHIPSDVETLRRVIEARVTEIQVGVPSSVVSYDPSTGTCSAQPLVRRPLQDIDRVVFENLPILEDIPIVWPQGGGYAITFPIKKGDLVILVATTWNAHNAMNSGEISDPNELKFQSVSSVFAHPGWRCDADPLVSATSDEMRLGRDGEDQAIEISDTEIRIGTGATEAIPREDLVQSALTGLQAKLDSLIAIFNAHVHLGILPGPGATAPSVPPETPHGPVAATASDLGRVK